MPKLRYVSFVLLLACVLGCGGGREEAVAVQPPPSDAKVMLEEIASSGSLQGKQDELREEFMGLGETNPEVAEELLADYEQLLSMSDSAAVKAKAEEMAGKL